VRDGLGERRGRGGSGGAGERRLSGRETSSRRGCGAWWCVSTTGASACGGCEPPAARRV
jgi:hypothetical protein